MTKTGRIKLIFWAAFGYMIAGLLSGLLYRELTKFNIADTENSPFLALTHVHLLALGMLMNLIALVLSHSFQMTRSPLFPWWFALYNAGVVITASMMFISSGNSSAIAGIAGSGHMLTTAGLVIFFINLYKSAFGSKSASRVESKVSG